MTAGINPYSFVPLERVERKRPQGHHKLADGNLSGTITLNLTARSHLYLDQMNPDKGKSAENATGSAERRIPGSSLKGAIRSVYETLVPSCMRILDTDYVPVHRSLIDKGLGDDWKMGVIAAIENNCPTKIQICDEWAKIKAVEAPKGGSKSDRRPISGVADWYTGQRFKDVKKLGKGKDKIERVIGTPIPEHSKTASDWVLLVSDTNARGDKLPVLFQMGKRGRHTVEVTAEAQSSFNKLIAGTRDLQPGQKQSAGAEREGFEPVYLPGTTNENAKTRRNQIGSRCRVDSLDVGIPLWIKTVGSAEAGTLTVTAMKISQVWREHGKHPLKERIGNANPCTGLELCPACQIFGSAGEETTSLASDGPSETSQYSYQGHIRWGDAVAKSCATESVDLAPLMGPKPSAGQFYLDNTTAKELSAEKEERPLAFWGSKADNEKPRQIRGRKMYWATTPKNGQNLSKDHRSQKTKNHTDNTTTGVVTLLKPGAEFTATLTFENLTEAQLGSLLAVLEPALLWPEGDYVHRVGGGKPFGWGAVTTEVTAITTHTTQERYLPTVPSAEPKIASKKALVATYQQSNELPITRYVQYLKNLMTFNYVPDADVRYPIDPDAQKDGNEVFSFWQKTNGHKGKQSVTGEIIALPDADQPAQNQELRIR